MNDEISEVEKDAIDNAKVKELGNWKNNQVYTEVEDKNQAKISTRWVVTAKVIGEDKIIKARLVARGFEDEEIKGIILSHLFSNIFKGKLTHCFDYNVNR